jgi:polysaccharide biosynthesis/export protein
MNVNLRVAVALMLALHVPVSAQQSAPVQPVPQTPVPVSQQSPNYIVGPQDVLVVNFYDQPELTGKFTVEADGSFTFPLIGRVVVGGMTLREVEATIEKELMAQGYFRDPQLAVSVETYRSQRIYVVGEVRTPGAYPLSGDMRLVEALALAGSTLPTASGEAVIVRATEQSTIVQPAVAELPTDPPASDPEAVLRVDLRELENGDLSQNVPLRSGDTIFVLRAESVYVFGQVRTPGAYPLRQKNTTVLQALSLAGGVTDRGATGRIQIIRIVDGKKQEIRASLTDFVLPRDTIIVPERFF